MVIIFFAIRTLINLFWRFYYWPYLDLLEWLAATGLWGYALYCGVRSYFGIEFKIPH
jgi:hypothetical protein